MSGPILWQTLKFYELDQVIRQSNIQFSKILTKIGNGEILNNDELSLIESRFFTIEEAQELCPNGVRLFYSNQSVNAYNNKILTEAENKKLFQLQMMFLPVTRMPNNGVLHLFLKSVST